MTIPLGPLGPADERFDHRKPDTFATVGTTDPSWTEKVCAMAAKRDGCLQLGFGMGKYLHRNVLDGYAGLARGVEQLTVRVAAGSPPARTTLPWAQSASRSSNRCSGCGSTSRPTSASRWPSTGSTRLPCRRPPRSGPTSGHRWDIG